MNMERISLEGKVAVVTGAGRGIGRGHALLLAERGAAVVVNDLGSASDGSGASAQVASEVVDIIKSRGGRAVANGADISTVEGGRSVVQSAVDAFGRIDIVVNNAGISHRQPFGETPIETFEKLWRIHLGGHVNVTQAAWPFLCRQRSGSIIMSGSGGGMFGLPYGAAYSSAKGAIYGLTRSLACEASEYNIRVNMLCPGGFTRMFEEGTAKSVTQEMDLMRRSFPPEMVAPAVVWLASDACDMNGQTFAVWGGLVVRYAIGAGNGYIDRDLTPEAIAANIEDVVSLDGFYQPGNGYDSMNHWKVLAG
jgi:NAD(P)-dependent dehydrogenase (short-subunit alcohol dehydrogenase family)